MSRFFADEKVNAERQPELDLLKALCIFGMIVVHVFLDLGDKVMPTFIDDYLTEFWGGATFMVCMGIGMRYMRNQSAKAYLTRGFGLLTIGQFVNICRNSIVNLIIYWITGENFFIANSFLILQADILTFAGLTFMLMALFKKLKLSDGVVLGIGVGMNLFALIMWNLFPVLTAETPDFYFGYQMLGFFIITKAEAYFPLCCYFIFAAFGYFIGGYYPRVKDKNALSNRVMLICFPIALAYYVVRFTVDIPFLPELGTDLQYNMKPTPDALATCLFTLGFIALLYKFVLLIKGKIPKFVLHFSENINRYYILSYMFILPVQSLMIAIWGTRMPGKILPIVYSLLVTVACYFIIELNNKHLNIHITSLKGKKMIIFAVVVWVLTIAIALYAYPRIEEFANIWNDYLLP